MYGKGLRPLSIATLVAFAASPSRWSSSTRRSKPTRASCRRSSTCTCRWRSSRSAASSPAGSSRSSTCAATTARYDAYSYVSIHISVIFAVGALITGSIWAKGSWGHWWVWDEPTLVSFLIVFLLYATYYPFRYAIEDRQRQARYASVFAITAGAFVPLNFMAVRLSAALVHPRVFATAEGGLPTSMMLTFLVASPRWRCSGRRWSSSSSGEERPGPAEAPAPRPRRAGRPAHLADRPRGPLMPAGCLLAAAPAIPNDVGGKYVAGAYLVFLVLMLIYVAIMGMKLARIERELRELAEIAEQRKARRGPRPRRCGPRSSLERAPRARRLAQDGAAGPARAPLADRGTRGRRAARADRGGDDPRGGGDLDLQPDRALPGRLRPGRGRVEALGVLTRKADIRPTELLGHLYSLRGIDASRHLCGSPPGSTR